MEDLTKQQIVLVTLLVSFVTSIATGIVTVSLMDQAPKAVTQTINRVVERTIEKVTPATNQAAAVITKETVVVKEDDYVTQSVEKNLNSFVRIKRLGVAADNSDSTFASLGLIATKDGIIVTNASSVGSRIDDFGNIIADKYIAENQDGGSYQLTKFGTDQDSGAAFFRAASTTDNGKKAAFTVPSFGDSDSLKLGQTVIALGGEKSDSVSVGIIQSLIPAQSAASNQATTSDKNISNNQKTKNVISIKADLKGGDDTVGALLLDLYGNVVGLKVGQNSPPDNSYLPIDLVNSLVSKMFLTATTTKKAGN